MSRKLILQVPFVIVAAIIVGALALAFWLIMLVPYLVYPRLAKPLTDKLTAQFTRQVAGMVMKGGRKKKCNPQRSQLLQPAPSESSEQ